MNNLRKVNKILFLTLLVFSIGVLGNYSETASKYWIADDSDNILNKTNFKGLTQEIAPNMQIIGDKVQVTVEFYRTAAIGDSKVVKDEIDFSLIGNSSSCKIIDISNSKNGLGKGFYKNTSNDYNPKPKEGNYQNNVKFTYNDVTSNASDNTSVTLTIECNADDIVVTEGEKKDHLQIEYLATETISTPKDVQTGDESLNTEVFKMFGGLYYSEDKYNKVKHYEITGDRKEKLILNSDELSASIINDWMRQYVDKNFATIDTSIESDPYDCLYNYIKYGDSWNVDSVLGLTYDATKKEYTFDDVIMSYAYTASVAHPDRRLYFVHFDDAKLAESKVNSLFEYYYDLYYKPKYSDSDNAEILQHITNNGGISQIVINNKKVTGVPYRYNYVVIDRDLIISILRPNAPDVILDFSKYTITGSSNTMMPYLAANVNSFVKDTFSIQDFDEEKIKNNIFLRNYVRDIQKKENPNDYYYLAIGDKLLSLRFHKDSNGDYVMSMAPFDDSTIDATAVSHTFIAMELYFVTSTNVNDYTDLKSQFLRYVTTIDNQYGSSFASDVPIDTILNNIINKTTNASEFIENTNNYSLSFAYSTVSVSGQTYGRLSFGFTPPDTSGQANEIDNTGNNVTNSITTGEVTQSTTTQEDLAEAAIVGGLSGVASKDNPSSDEARD